jgi:hypothetical protein
MKLIVKNNVTVLHMVDVKGSSGTGILEVTKILKKSPHSPANSEHYLNAHTLNGHVYGPSSHYPIFNDIYNE